MTEQERIDELVESIHVSDIYGSFIEMGCGVAVANALMNIAGATDTVYMTESPYAREYQHGTYGNEGLRAVSKECVSKINDVMLRWDSMHEDFVNTVYIASFQLGDETGSKSTHGWIAYRYKGNLKFYHISIHEKMTRKEYLQRIALCGLKIILNRNEDVIQDACIDMVYGFDDNRIAMFDMISNSNDENFLCIRDGQFCRMEDFFREKNNILLFKGSFNPIHQAHIEILEAMEVRYEDKPVLMISAEIYGKGFVNSAELKSRVDDLNNLGYDVIVSRSGFFNTNIKYIGNKFRQPIVFGMGSDTLIRIFQSTYPILSTEDQRWFFMTLQTDPATHFLMINNFNSDFGDAKLFVVERKGFEIPSLLIDDKIILDHLVIHDAILPNGNISSTQIRNGENIHLVPEKIRDKYKK